MSVIAQLPKDLGGAEGKVAYIGMFASSNLRLRLTVRCRYGRHLQARKDRADCGALWCGP
ncbi:hypothetical protein BU26DRAFT_521015 [Trematosphaeria pertusa]|uniref:Uncharacterized protein n=1 Tax=Trematosphaeria pertusa TaxID=390896 RepID=A0A6A6I7N2_9PLEO|nr:uncharacterized protein BU26DRAFT_521015 [Trematosphaeria pertusa]KAF2246564.1 hypothetical protein BU26DRAFT_521015 [Trematosphaeria pertusa]